jgi:flagellar biosynthetic protein FliQ
MSSNAKDRGIIMTQNQILFMAKEALGTALMVGGPVLLISLLVGLLVSIFQAMTQIQEQTLTFIPKILSIVLVLLLLGPWMLNVMTAYTTNLFTELANYARF